MENRHMVVSIRTKWTRFKCWRASNGLVSAWNGHSTQNRKCRW